MKVNIDRAFGSLGGVQSIVHYPHLWTGNDKLVAFLGDHIASVRELLREAGAEVVADQIWQQLPDGVGDQFLDAYDALPEQVCIRDDIKVKIAAEPCACEEENE